VKAANMYYTAWSQGIAN